MTATHTSPFCESQVEQDDKGNTIWTNGETGDKVMVAGPDYYGLGVPDTPDYDLPIVSELPDG